MKTILFHGDSITSWFRSRERDDVLGSGYATQVAGELGCKYPNEYHFENRAVGGNRSVNLLATVRPDIIALNPDYMSLLIGVNDVWHAIDFDNGVSPERYEIYLNMLIEEVRESLPNIKFMILEPFVLEGPATDKDPERFLGGMKKISEKARAVAEANDAVFVPLQEKFDEALKSAPFDYWTTEGVHPTAAGHNIIKNAWIEAFEKYMR